MKNRSQDLGRAGFHPRAGREWPSRPAPLPFADFACVPGPARGRSGTRGRRERAGRGAWTDSWPRRRGAGVAGGRGLGSNFPEKQPTCSRNDSKRRGKRKKKKSSVTTSNQRTRKVFFKWARLFLCLFKTLKPCSKRGCVRWSLPPPSLPHPRPRRHGREV